MLLLLLLLLLLLSQVLNVIFPNIRSVKNHQIATCSSFPLAADDVVAASPPAAHAHRPHASEEEPVHEKRLLRNLQKERRPTGAVEVKHS
jgi:hypothetical protein